MVEKNWFIFKNNEIYTEKMSECLLKLGCFGENLPWQILDVYGLLYVAIFLLNPDGVANICTKFQLYGNFFVYIFQEV